MKCAREFITADPGVDLEYMRHKFREGHLKHAEKLWEDSYTLYSRSSSRSLATLLGFFSREDFELHGDRDAQYLCSFVAPSSIALDLGCGVGRVISYLAPHCQEIHGTDVSSTALRFAQERCQSHRNVFSHKGNGLDLSCFLVLAKRCSHTLLDTPNGGDHRDATCLSG